MAISIPIISEFSPKGIDKAIKEFQRLEGAGAKAQFALSKAALPAAAALAGLTAAAGVSIKKAIEAESAQSRLANILRTTGGATEEQVGALNRQAEALQKVGVASAGNITVLQSQLATFDLQFDTIERLTPAITDYVIAEKGATASAEDFKSMTNALAQALQGNFTALTKSGFVLDETTKGLIKNGSEAERSAALVDVLNSTYKDFNITARDTAEGRMVALRNSLESVQEKIGRALLPSFEALLKVLEKFAGFLENNTGLVVGIGIAIGVFSGAILLAAAAFKVYAAITAIATAATAAFGVALSATGIGAVIVLVGLLVAGFVSLMIHSQRARDVMKAVVNAFVAGFERVVNSVIFAINMFIRMNNTIGSVLRFVGINLGQVAEIGYVSFGRLGKAADAAGDSIVAVNSHLIELQRNIPRISAINPTLVSLSEAQTRLADATKKVDDLRRLAKTDRVDPSSLADALKEQSEAQRVVNDMLGDTAGKAGRAGKAVETYSQRFKKALEEAVDSAKGRLKEAQEAMTQFSESVRDALLGAFGFREALEAGEETGGGFLAGLQKQADKVLEYSKQVRQLLDAGLSRDALSMVLEAGSEAGAEIAKQLIEGGAAAIAETNRLVESTKLAADEIGVLAGERYFGAGVAFAQAVVDGLQDRLRKLTPRLMAQMDALARGLKRTVDVDVRIREIVQRVEARVGGIPALAAGGIVTRPTLALIGEAGPEAVVPLSRLSQQQVGGGDTTINIYSTIADESLPEKLVQALRTYNRTTGPVRVQVI